MEPPLSWDEPGSRKGTQYLFYFPLEAGFWFSRSASRAASHLAQHWQPPNRLRSKILSLICLKDKECQPCKIWAEEGIRQLSQVIPGKDHILGIWKSLLYYGRIDMRVLVMSEDGILFCSSIDQSFHFVKRWNAWPHPGNWSAFWWCHHSDWHVDINQRRHHQFKIDNLLASRDDTEIMCVLLIMIIIVITDHQRRPEKSLFTHVVLESVDTEAKWQSQSFNIAIDPGDHRHDQRFESHLRWRSRSTP